MWGSCGHRHRLVITTQGIDLLTACSLILPLFPFSKTVSHTWIMWTHWSADWEILFRALGHYWRRDYPALVFFVHVGECITPIFVTAHIPPAHLRFAMAAQKKKHSHLCTQSTYSGLHNQHGPNDCLHWLPSICNYVPIVYFLASYSFKRNSIIIALFNVKVSKSGGCGAPVALSFLSMSMTPPRLLYFLGQC